MRYALGIEYDGSGFFGWQTQKQSPTVQECLEKAVSRVADHPVSVTCAGRTDTGVHALGQVVHFDSESERTERSWILGVNAHLTDAASALWIRQVDEDFHARFSAYSRSYRYRMLNRWIRPAIGNKQIAWVREPLDESLMHQSAQALLGEHDFGAFRAAGCQANHGIREIQEVRVARDGQQVSLDISANGFLYHMVRNIAGSLIEVGRGLKPVEWIAELLASKDRKQAGVTAPPGGLYFLNARYPDHYGLPTDEVMAFPRGWNQS